MHTLTRGSRSMLRVLRRPRIVEKIRSPPSRVTQMTLVWGAPSGLVVARIAKALLSTRRRARSERASAMAPIMPAPPAIDDHNGLGVGDVTGDGDVTRTPPGR